MCANADTVYKIGEFSKGMILKRCSRCGAEKSQDEFHRDRSREDGKFPQCKQCSHEGNVSARRKELKRAREKGPKYRAYINNYRQGEKSKEYVKQYNSKHKASDAGKASTKLTVQRYPKRYRARRAVNDAVRVGKLPSASLCECYYSDEHCTGIIQYHHHRGYEKERQLDVIPVCSHHHGILKREYGNVLENFSPD